MKKIDRIANAMNLQMTLEEAVVAVERLGAGLVRMSGSDATGKTVWCFAVAVGMDAGMLVQKCQALEDESQPVPARAAKKARAN